MAWTYDASDLDTSTYSGRLNVVRFLVGDTDASNPQVQNEEVSFSLTLKSNDVTLAAKYIAEHLYARYSSYVDVELDGQLKLTYKDLADRYLQMSISLDSRASEASVKLGVLSTGTTPTGWTTAINDPNRITPAFTEGQFDNDPVVEVIE